MEEIINKPAHIAIIMDGNRRWATEQGLDKKLGHKKGEEDTTPKQLISGFMAYLKSEDSEDNGANAAEQGQDPMKEEQE